MPADQTIAEWTTTDLIKFIQAVMRDDETVRALSAGTDDFKVSNRLTVNNELAFSQPGTTTVGTAGAASAPPASPELYIKVVGPDGTIHQIPLYKTA